MDVLRCQSAAVRLNVGSGGTWTSTHKDARSSRSWSITTECSWRFLCEPARSSPVRRSWDGSLDRGAEPAKG
ncbi:Uncharacterised protein [Mycobacteroides abscessus subsp. abscessus]|nr:Uncharacterised protein [Mycobacteroides abscessus subsp. abscessus]